MILKSIYNKQRQLTSTYYPEEISPLFSTIFFLINYLLNGLCGFIPIQ